MNRGVVIGALGGLAAGVSLGAVALATPSFALFSSGNAATVAPMVGQVTAPAIGQVARWGTLPNLADLVENVAPAVVQIDVRSSVSARSTAGPGPNPFEGTPFEDFFQFRGAPNGAVPEQRGSGSGFFIEGGYIVTNNHVVENATKLTVVLQDGRTLDATLVGTDPKTDLAVIKVEGSSLPRALPWGNSDQARPGDSVFAVGAPFGLSNTVTAGIVSARGRNINSGQYDDFIQVDAAINRGNSGGPLFDASGAVIGVNSAIFSPSGGNVGIGFSIPSSQARGIVQQIIENGSVERGWLGVAIGPVTPEIADSLALAAAKGAMVSSVTSGSPADKAGVREGDIILRYGDRPIADVRDLTRAVADTKAGTTRDLRVFRGGREQTLRVNIAALKDDAPAPALASVSPRSGAGDSLALSSLGLSLRGTSDGLVVASVEVNSPASEAGIRVGDKVLQVNQTSPSSPEAARKAVDDARNQNRKAVLLQLQRNDTRFFVGVPISEG